MEGLEDLARSVLDKLLAGEHPVLGALRVQAQHARLLTRESTGVGFYCSFDVPPDIPIVEPRNFEIDDVNGELQGLAHGAGFVLFIRDGRLDMLEGFSYNEPWPSEIRNLKLNYHHEPRKLKITVYSADPE